MGDKNMKKNDKIIVVLGVIMLVLASIGIYYYEPIREIESVTISEFQNINGVLKNIPEAISVSDCNPFYPLIATPVAVHYNIEGEQELIPLFVENMESPSNAIVRIKESLYLFSQEKVDGSKSAKEVSLEFAEKFWERSDAALVIEYNQAGYELGIIATPIASYLSIPIIVTDSIDGDVSRVLSNLGVKKTIICGENLEPLGKYLKFETVDDAVDATIQVITERFIKTRHDRIDYITLTNPVDAFPPNVLDSVEYYFGPETAESSSMNRENTLRFLLGVSSRGVTWEFTIPDDYKYALIEFEGYNHELDGVDEFGDVASFNINPVEKGELSLGGASTANSAAKRDRAGNVIEDKVYFERVLYDCGGKTYRITAKGSWTLLSEGQVSARLNIKKLDNPVYEMMGGLSTIAPYLTAYYKGIVFGKTDFAFTADDNVITDTGETSPGFYTAGRNIDLVPRSNKHIFDNIHEPLNQLLAKLADLPYDKAIDLKPLTEHYRENPVYIAIVGGTTVIPRYIYENEVGPIGNVGWQSLFAGGGTPSDNIYANIDPVKYNYDNIAPDVHSVGDYPYLENIVGRITGWDVQDANALILRSMFYDDLIEDLSIWKENFGNLFGGGVDFRAPLWVQTLNRLPVIRQILGLINTATGSMLNLAVGPWKIDTGFSRIMAQTFENEIGKKLGFNVQTALHEEAMINGYSSESLNKIKQASLWNRLTFSKSQIESLAGEGNVKGREILENSNFIWLTGHGSPYLLGLEGVDLVSSGTSFIGLNLWQRFYKNLISPYFVVGFWGPGGGLCKAGEYAPRIMSTVELGPSFIWVESCFVGKITGITPKANVGQGILHAGAASMVSSTSGSNIPGGYLPGKPFMFDTWIGTRIREKQWERKVEQDIYPDFHFGSKIYADMCNHLSEGKTVGEAFRDAKNQYLPEDEGWELWWSPPLDTEGAPVLGWDTHIAPKYTSFLQYQLYGDPAFRPYMPQ
jgi:hypothetical protein